MSVKDRLIKYLKYKKLGQTAFEEKAGLSRGQIAKKQGFNGETVEKIAKCASDLNPAWLLTGEGEMLKTESQELARTKKLIPFYDDVTTIGGVNDRIANTDDVSSPSEYIDTGDWFREATAAIRHYGDSMIEYPPGCILALKEVDERQLIIWGKDYVIETSEYRITKRLQRGKDEEHIRAYSSNKETYPDGQLVHEHLDIAWKDIRRIFLVLGYVVKKNGGTVVYSNPSR